MGVGGKRDFNVISTPGRVWWRGTTWTAVCVCVCARVTRGAKTRPCPAAGVENLWRGRPPGKMTRTGRVDDPRRRSLWKVIYEG